MRFIRYSPEHYMAILKCPDEDLERHGMYAHAHMDDLIAETLIDGEAILACGGVHELWGAVVEAWLILAPGTGRSHEAVNKLKREFTRWSEMPHVHRIQAVCVAEDRKQTRFCEWLGMVNEGVLVKYGPRGESFAMYARVK